MLFLGGRISDARFGPTLVSVVVEEFSRGQSSRRDGIDHEVV
jgi:hypothetical protein